ncbi:MAG: RNA-binding cell elongation regulator Jag/EloR [Armatimonadota bacterium]|nr:RNA-binding cell elongation regulator Jag/EloR [Armatimonadota bacterium]
MKEIEASGRTLEEALQIAAQQLGVSLDALEYEIIEEGSRGFLGLGQTPTVIKARVKESEVQATEPERSYEVVHSSEQQPEIPADEDMPQEPQAQEETPAEAESATAQHPEDDTELLVDTILRTVREIIEPMKVNARPELKSVTHEEIVVDLVGPEVAILIGKRGQTLDALQYLVGVIVNRRVRCRRRIILDAENYRVRHQEMLVRKAKEYAKAVKEQGKEAVLEPQCARDRRIIHLALADDPDVYTYSEGEGDERHVVISPKKK